ncbi:ParB/RepB/Spo0J family partition protein [Massilia violaceinigra]|uniref:ParB/RepB/Spo0J family partition protein n=1 Tax=Massilia violaceinigra TaxID=2045208 RepID=A0ABY4A7G7_9BURK|nr:ParB/RepB/Spo0J family partition protein [Massilia violaceinigra]UOD30724.1 ParB/RepB/Spo0J family partition protein [Massilia violaceinigra]
MKKNITKPAALPATATNDGIFGVHNVAEIRPSPDNRKRFNQLALQELAASIKSIGVAQPILIRPITPTADSPERYEIVAGERRWRASIIAGIKVIPAMVREMSDRDAAMIRILENLQREDPHPLEEAMGYEQLMLQFGYNADQVAEEIKKSRSYVYGRLKLCALTNEVRELFLDNKISASTALLIARIPVPTLQEKALDEIINPKNAYPAGEPLSYRRAVEHIQNRYMLDLATAVFPVGDGKLLAAAGACTKCPKRTGNQPEIFSDIKSADVCTDPDCFGEKKAAHFAKVVVTANKKGVPVLEGADAKKALPNTWQRDSELVRGDQTIWTFDRNAPSTKNSGTVNDFLDERTLPPVANYFKNDDGTVTAFYDRQAVQQALEKVGACETVEQHAERMSLIVNAPKSEAQIAKDVAETELKEARLKLLKEENAFRLSLYKRFRDRAANGLSLDSLREFVKLILLDNNDYSLPSDILDVYGEANHSDEEVCAYIDKASLQEVQLILVDLVLGECLQVDSWDLEDGRIQSDDRFETLSRMARIEGIDPGIVREQLYPLPIVTSALQYDDLVTLIRISPERINELAKAVIADASRFDLIDALERAAKGAGFVYAAGGFIKADTDGEHAPEAAVAVPDTAPVEQGNEPPHEVVTPISSPRVKVKAKIKTKTAVMAPVEAWPFPRSPETAIDNHDDTPPAEIELTPKAEVSEPIVTEEIV